MTRKQSESILNEDTDYFPRALTSSPCMLQAARGVYAGHCDEEEQLALLQELSAAARQRMTVTNSALTHAPAGNALKLLQQNKRDELARFSALTDAVQLLAGKVSKDFGEPAAGFEQPDDLTGSLRFLRQNQVAVVSSLNTLLPRLPPGELIDLLKSMRAQHTDTIQYINAYYVEDNSGEEDASK